MEVVLVVDDDLAFLKGIERLLEMHGFEVKVFDSGRSLQNLCTLKEALCVLMDINLGEASGIELRRCLAKSNPSLPVIFITGNDNENTREAALDAGCVAYLTKPFSSASLIKAIDTARRAKCA